jgi:predicted nucleic acid-binding protein
VIYLDTSAFVPLVRREATTAAMSSFLADRPGVPLASSALLVAETRRAVQREDSSLLPRADLLLTRVNRIDITTAIVETASRLPEPSLRSLDAIHLATALLIGDGVEAFVCYDKRLAAAAEALGLRTAMP